MFLIWHVTSRKHMFKGLYGFTVEASHGQSPLCHAWWRLATCKWRYKVSIVSLDLMKPLD